LQLNYANPKLQQALIDTLNTIAVLCDGVRCDTAITGLKEVFCRTWGELGCQMETEFWDRAIAGVKKTSPDFLFIAEVSTEAFAHVEDYQHVRIVSTEMHRSPQFDLWPGGITVRLRGHEGLLLMAR
jgi:hypothetical protein